MIDPSAELMEELDAFCPAWRKVYPSVGAAAKAAGVLNLYVLWLYSPAGAEYLKKVGLLPDYIAAMRRLARLEMGPYRSLPFSLDHLPDRFWDVKEKE
jgi:hypothetical protein